MADEIMLTITLVLQVCTALIFGKVLADWRQGTPDQVLLGTPRELVAGAVALLTTAFMTYMAVQFERHGLSQGTPAFIALCVIDFVTGVARMSPRARRHAGPALVAALIIANLLYLTIRFRLV